MFNVELFDDYINEQLDELKDIVENNKFTDEKCINFISNQDLEDELSHNEIYMVQKEFIRLAKEYLRENHNGKFIIFCDWCVHICTVKFYENHLSKCLKVYLKC